MRSWPTADVFIQNYRVGTAERLGAGYATPARDQPEPRLLLDLGLRGDGAVRGRPGQDLVVQGYSGSLFSVGSSEMPPMPGALWAADTMTGYQAAVGILSALLARERIGGGQKIEVSMLGVVMDCQAAGAHHLPQPGPAAGAHAGALRARLGHRSVRRLSHRRRLDDHRAGAARPARRGARRRPPARHDRLGRRHHAPRRGLRHRQRHHPVARRRRSGRPSSTRTACGAGRSTTTPRSRPIRTSSRPGCSPRSSTRVHGELRMPAPPLRMSETPPTVRTAPPILGQHTDEVLVGRAGLRRGAARAAAPRRAPSEGGIT